MFVCYFKVEEKLERKFKTLWQKFAFFLLKHRKIERKTFSSAKFPCKTLLMRYFLLPWTSLSIIKAIPIQCFRNREKSIEKTKA